MKTKTLFKKTICLILLVGFISTNFGCKAMFDMDIDGDREIPRTEDGFIDIKEMDKRMEEYLANEATKPLSTYPQSFIGLAGGFGLNSVEGESTTSYCFGGEYNYRVVDNDNNGAGYIAGFANYNAESSDNRDLNLLSAGLKYTHFDRITANGEVDLTYSVKGFYESGSLDSFGFEEDITGYGASLSIGANYNVTDKFSIGVEIPFFTYRNRTFEYEDQEIDQSSTWLGLNKGNVAMAYARIGL